MSANDREVGGKHYQTDVQPWDAMAAWLPPEQFEGFLRANSIKYLSRAGRKGPALQDYRKAHHYLEKLIEVMENGNA